MGKSLHLSTTALLLLIFLCTSHNVFAQCTEPNSDEIFQFIPGNDTLFVNGSCISILDFGDPSIETTFAEQVIDEMASGIDVDLTTALESAPLSAGQQVTVYYIGVEAAPTTRRDTFCYTIDIVDATPPTFLEFPANDTVCINAVPVAAPLSVADNCIGDISIQITDDTLDADGFCNGGMIRRIWEATDLAGNISTISQLIIIEADQNSPAANYEVEAGIAYCGASDFNNWVNAALDSLSANASDDCSVQNIFKTGPNNFRDCGTVLVNFNIEDSCGNITSIQSSYTILDTIAPVFLNPPSDITVVACSLSEVDTLDVGIMDNCDDLEDLSITINDVIMPVGNACGDVRINRTWTVFDACGNSAMESHIITLTDTIAPEFDLPPDIMVDCGVDYEDLFILGTVTNISDNCNSPVEITRADSMQGIGGILEIRRYWSVSDACGNSRTKVQVIEAIDTIPPSFDPPLDAEVDCAQLNDLNATGQPRMLSDNCGVPVLTYEDSFNSGNCSGNGAIQRIWTATDDAGNIRTWTQEIRVEDDILPTIVIEASDRNINCADTIPILDSFNEWIATMGGALAMDNCTADSNLIWTAFNAGTNNAPSLGQPNCPSDSLGVFRSQAIDFVVRDLCGNMATTRATFNIVDNTAPVFAFCPSDTTLLAVNNSCSANFMLIPPRVIEECGATFGLYTRTINAGISSDDPGNADVPVNRVRLSFPFLPSQDFPIRDASLFLRLVNIDANQSTEYFLIYLEDGTLLGRTANGSSQCGVSETTINNIDAAQIIQSAGSNNLITFYLEPYIPPGQEPSFAISDVCGGSYVDATLSFETLTPSGTTYAFTINDGIRLGYLPSTPVIRRFDAGVNTIVYYVTDCAGNTSTCSYQVTVSDSEAPGITCPDDVVLALDSTDCVVRYPLPLPDIVTDNCIFGNSSEITAPADSTAALLRFTYQADLLDFLADDVVLTFENVNRSTINDVSLTISLRGDMDNDLGYFNILGEDGTLLGTTQLGQANVAPGGCSQFSQVFINIPAANYNSWAIDGELTITAALNRDIPIPPNGPGDGFNPCDITAVNQDGDTDDTSMLFGTLSYNDIQYSYYTEGATDTPLTLVSDTVVQPEVDFAIGTTEVFYIIEDGNSNQDTCSFLVTVEDNEAPLANCISNTRVFINPSGLATDTIRPFDINLNSSDNCLIDTMFVTPNAFSCDMMLDEFVDVSLTVVDSYGNASTCVSSVNIVSESPEPSFFVPPCGGDSLYLYAQPPAAPSGTTYTYAWTGPNGFVSNEANPILSNITAVNEGSYSVMVTGLTGCTAAGTVEVSIDENLSRPDIEVPAQICSSDDLTLRTPRFDGLNVSYRWYSGEPSNRVLLGTTTSAALVVGGPMPVGMQTYFVELNIDGCVSNPSELAVVEVIEMPTAVIENANPDPICEGDILELSTLVTDQDLTYEWTGPNGFRHTLQNPPVITDVSILDEGIYYLSISRGGCVSERVSTEIQITPKPAKPILFNNGPVCAGEDVVFMSSDSLADVYHWFAPNSNSEQINVENSLTVTAASAIDAGAWRVYVTRDNCHSELSDPATLVVNPIPDLAIAANPDVLCEGSTLNLEASPMLLGATYEWSGPNGYVAATQNPILPNVLIANEGTYFCTINTAAGCSNTAATQVTVDAGIEILEIRNNGPECVSGPTDILIRPTLFPPDDGTYIYEWHGPNSFVSADSIATIPNATEIYNGNYTLLVTNGRGCTSELASTTVAIREAPQTPSTPVIGEGTPAPFCAGETLTLVTNSYSGTQVEYHWRTPADNDKVTNVPSLTIMELEDGIDSGEYAVYVLVDGCTSAQSGVIQVEVGSIPVVEATTNSPVCEGGRLELQANIIPGATYEWQGPSGITASSSNPVFEFANPDIHEGIYTLQATLNGCSSETVLADVMVNELPKQPIGAAAAAVCIDEDGAVLRLAVMATSATVGANYVWYDQNNNALGTLTNDALIFTLTDFTGYSEGTYEFFVQAEKDGCVSERSDAVEVDFNEIPIGNSFAGQDVASCGESIVTLDAVQPSLGTGMWTQVGGDSTAVRIINPTENTTVITGLEDGNSYQFAWTLSNGVCFDYAIDTVDVLISSVSGADAGLPIDTCLVSSVALRATKPVSGQGMWTQPVAQDSLGVTIVDPLDPNSAILGLQAGNQYIFTWEVLGAACGDSQDVTVVTVSGGFAYAGIDFEACGDGCIELDAEPSPTGAGQWSSPDIEIAFNEANNPSTLVCDLQTGQNMFIWTVDNGACGDASRDTLIVTYEFPAIVTDDAITTLLGDAIDIDVRINDFFPNEIFMIGLASEPLNGKVEDLGNGNFRYRSNPNFAGVDIFEYEVCSPGCECVTASVRISVDPPVSCNIPNIFTPNNDGVNEFFVIPCLSQSLFPGNIFTVFNQWGDEVFRMENYDNSWDGTFDGEPLPHAYYYYIMDFNDGEIPTTGYINILR